MSTTAEAYLVQHPTPVERLRATVRRLAGRPRLVVGLGCVGLLVTFAAMLATGGPARIGTIWFVPWVVLLAAELGPSGGALSGLGASLLNLAAAELTTDPDDALAFDCNERLVRRT